jgi:cell division protein FtsL
MIRKTTMFWALMAIFAGVSMLVLKHQVRTLEGDLRRLERAIVAEQEAIHVLNAEWAYLNQPARLERLGRGLMGLVPAAAEQQTDLAELERALRKPDPEAKPELPPMTGLRVEAAVRTGD